MVRWVLLIGLLAGCGARSAPAPVTNASAPPDAGLLEPLAKGCPMTWDDAQGGIACDPAISREVCGYGDGSCSCGVVARCSGAVLPPEEEAALPTVWNCTPTPPAIRADGCPGTQPNGACSSDGQSCWYGSCCVTEVVCQGGQWQLGRAECPP